MIRKGDQDIKMMCDTLRILATDPNFMVRIIGEIEEMLLHKGDDYSGVNDAFANFKTSAMLAHLPVAQGIRYMIAIKVGRLLQLTSNTRGVRRFESELDSWKDLMGYILLMLAYLSNEE